MKRRHFPERTVLLVDALLPVFGLLGGLTVVVYLLGTETAGLPRVPALFGGLFLGLLLLRLYRHRFRALGFIPLGTTLAAMVALIAATVGEPSPLVLGLFALGQGLALGGLFRYRDRVRWRLPRFTIAAILALGLAGLPVALFLSASPEPTNPPQIPLEVQRLPYKKAFLGLSVGLAILSQGLFLRALIELIVEPFMRRMYRVKVVGPGVEAFPVNGPVLVIANHAAWFDPLFVAESVPRATTQMMTAGFYDVRGIRFLMRYVFRTIRVAEVTVRREAPELTEAIQALQAGRCVVLFPEGYLRRKEELVMRRFGRGVWHILQGQPRTPVVPVWIEGSWGSYFSHANGPPTRNKSKDRHRPITVSVGRPVVVPPEVLADQLQTRLYLMKQVNLARTHQGLPELPTTDWATDSDGASGETPSLAPETDANAHSG